MNRYILKNKLFKPVEKIIIALDGPAASGKGTIAKLLAKNFDLKYFDSGLLYRYLAFKCNKEQVSLENTEKIINLANTINNHNHTDFLYNEDTANIASKIGVISEVRNAINHQLKAIIHDNLRIIMDGRDIGSVVAPEADLKIFITASLQVRAARRFNQLNKQGKECIMSEVLEKLAERDKRDQERKDSPLKATKDSLIIDTSDITPENVVEIIIDYVNREYHQDL